MERLRDKIDTYTARGMALTEAVDEVRQKYTVIPVSATGLLLGTAPGLLLVFLCISILSSFLILGTPLYMAMSIPSRFIAPGYILAGLTGLCERARTGAGLTAYSIGLSLAYLAMYGYAAGLLGLYSDPLAENAFFLATLLVLDTAYLFKTRRYIMKRLEAVEEMRHGGHRAGEGCYM